MACAIEPGLMTCDGPTDRPHRPTTAAAAPTSSAACSSNCGADAHPAIALNAQAHAAGWAQPCSSGRTGGAFPQGLQQLRPETDAAVVATTSSRWSASSDEDDDDDDEDWPLWPCAAATIEGGSSGADEADDACSSRKASSRLAAHQERRRQGCSKQLRALMRRAEGSGRRDAASSKLLLAYFIRLLLAVTARHAPPALAHQLRLELARQYAAAAAASGAAPIAISGLLARLSPTLLVQLVLAFRSHRADRLHQQLLAAATSPPRPKPGVGSASSPPAAGIVAGSPPLKLGNLLEGTLTAAAEHARSAARVTSGSTTQHAPGLSGWHAFMSAPAGQATLQLPPTAALFATQFASNTSANSSCSEGSKVVDVEGVMWQELAAACCRSS